MALFMPGAARAHDGPPFPIASEVAAGPYVVSIWTDPDTTDDGTPGGQFWVVLRAPSGGEIPDGTRVEVSISPLDRAGESRRGSAQPVDGNVDRQFVALLMDHEGRFSVRAAIEGPAGDAVVESSVAATYDARPPLPLLFLYLAPFVLIAALWLRVLIRRRQRRAGSGDNTSSLSSHH
jgi:hypothetical protein